MKKQSIKGLALIAVAGSLVTSCNQMKELDYTVTPNPLEMHGDSIRVKIDVTFPVKGIRKKASAEITPMLGNTALKSIIVQGEKATGNGSVIQFKPGGSMSYTDVVAYKPEFENTDLKITGTISKGGKVRDQIIETKIADATIITPLLVNKDFKVILAKDEFKRVNEKSTMAQINFDKGRSVVKTNELTEKDVKDLSAWMAAAEKNAKIAIKSINVTGYASPEGEEDKNNTLSTDRSEAAKKSVMELAKKAANTKGQSEIYQLAGRGEDFDGFKAELEKSAMNNDEKQLIVRVLEMNQDPATRETEMRNMGKTFTYLDKNIFPKLRRAEIKVTFDLTGFSDEELKAMTVSNPDTLTVEELLFAATLTTDLNEKLRIYKIAQKNFSSDFRTSNNVGAVLYMLNKMAEAKAEFEKANSTKDNAISKNNLAAIAGIEGDRTKTKQLLGQAKGAGSEVNYNMGILNVLDGDYPSAISNFGSDATFNKALAQVLNGDIEVAGKTINDSPDKESAQGFYLKAIIAARLDKLEDLVGNMKSAIAKDISCKAQAMKDREFLKYAENASFSTIVK
jgi:outer membrane protein OmpA-like peptidoglycan-associated protein